MRLAPYELGQADRVAYPDLEIEYLALTAFRDLRNSY
jgi:hypothetical protein